MKVGFIGLGIMGGRMAANLQKAGHTLAVHNRTRERAEALLAAGARWAATPAEAARDAECLVTMLSEPSAVRAMAQGPEGFLEAMDRGALWMDCSTVNPSFAREMGAAAARRGLGYLDAPVSGSKGPAEKGELAFLVGGEAAHVDAARPLLEAMGNAVNHAGPVGSGAAMKMVTNLLLGMGMLAFSEALVFGQSMGIAKDVLLESLLGGRMTPGFLLGRKAKFATEQFDTDFPLKWMLKDLQLVAETAYETGAALPAAHATKEVFALAKRAGLGELDSSAVYLALARPGKA
jgi:3-hydroxyisobutyrate dehydrogenase/glyoxylate/succinic semialdehyde reductase